MTEKAIETQLPEHGAAVRIPKSKVELTIEYGEQPISDVVPTLVMILQSFGVFDGKPSKAGTLERGEFDSRSSFLYNRGTS